MREVYRLQKNSLTATLKNRGKFMAVFFIYTGHKLPEYKEVAEWIQPAIKKLNKIADEAIAPDT